MAAGDRRVMGRATTCDFTIADQTVSARHAELVRLDGGWLIRDLNSRNGTRVNGWLVTEQRLEPGDTVTLGTTVFVFDGV
jgi:pSer/pThr/pTyr-binding forkhead associated (FHA) protein